jgi:sugar lactone lactonase YvrE
MRTSRAPVLVCAAALATACAHRTRDTKPIVWPDAPDTPRVRYLRTIQSAHDVQSSGWNAFLTVFVGGSTGVRIARPQGLAISDDGNRLYVTDTVSGVILVDFEKHAMSKLSLEEQVSNAFGVALDASENLYVVSTSEARVYAFARDGSKIATIGKELHRPTGVAIDRKRQILYVSDTGTRDSGEHRVVAYSLQGQLLRTIGSRGHGDGQFNFPTSLAVDPDGNLFVADTLNFRIQIFDADGNFVRTFGEQGDVPGTFGRIKGLAFDRNRNLYVVDAENAAVQMFDAQLRYLMFFGGAKPRYEYMELPSPITIDASRNLVYVGDGGMTARVNVYELVNLDAPPAPDTDTGSPEQPTKGGAPRSPVGDPPQRTR